MGLQRALMRAAQLHARLEKGLAGQCLGGEMTFPSAARFVGDSAWLESIQLVLREDSVERAVAAFPDPDVIVERNIATLDQLGVEGWNRLLAAD